MAKLVYPPLEHTTGSETIFFIGSAKKSCFINQQEVELVHEGNFCPVFDLKLGDNEFELELDGLKSSVHIKRTPVLLDSMDYVYKPYLGKETPNEFLKICLDPGHGGEAKGTTSPKGILEKDLNLKLCLEIETELLKKGFEVILTRRKDEDLSLEKRVEISKGFGADLFLSIHHNAIPDNFRPLEHEGLSAHYYHEHSKELADEMSLFLSKKLVLKNNSSIRQNLYVTRQNLHSKAILLECGYLIHPIESEKLVKAGFQRDMASHLADFLSKYIKNF